MQKPTHELANAELEWRGNLPCSKQFDDLYYSQEDGLAESRYVFLAANQICERLSGDEQEAFIIAETGFGTGLNFFATLEAYKTLVAPRPLHFVSIEKYPLNLAQIDQALSAWPSLKSTLKAELRSFAEQYPAIIPGAHQLYFCQGRVCLTLIWGDVLEDFPRHCFSVDAWYLDGFNPANNPEMWQQDLFEFMAARAKSGCSLATFTAAGFVRRGLQQAGFELNKQQGFGRKREMLIGRISESAAPTHSSSNATTRLNHYYPTALPDWAKHNGSTKAQPEASTQGPAQAQYQVAVIGAGLAGLNSAYQLAEQGLKVILIDALEQPMAGASGQEQLIMYSKLPAIWNQEARLACKFLSHGQNYYRQLQAQHPEHLFWQQCGQIQLDWNENEQVRSLKRQANHPLPSDFVEHIDASKASDLAQITLTKGGQWFPNNGVLNSQIFAQALSASAKFTTRYQTKLTHLDYQHEHACWQLSLQSAGLESHSSAKGFSATITAEKVVIASAASAKQLAQCSHLPLKTIRGQSSTTFVEGLAGPVCVLCGEGYLCPSNKGSQHFGASYELNDSKIDSRLSSHHSNIEKLCHWLPEWQQQEVLRNAQHRSKAGLRCTTPDYFPIVGPAPNASTLKQHYQALKHNADADIPRAECHYPGLYVNVGHGSKGLVSSALAARHLSALICELPSPLEQEQIGMLSPSRFLIRELVRASK